MVVWSVGSLDARWVGMRALVMVVPRVERMVDWMAGPLVGSKEHLEVEDWGWMMADWWGVSSAEKLVDQTVERSVDLLVDQ